MSQGSDDGNDRQRGTAFQKLICNLLLDIHPIVVARFTHPLLSCNIYTYYLNFHTIHLEYARTESFQTDKIKNINGILIRAAGLGHIIIVKWCLENKADVHHNDDFALTYAADNGHLKIVKLLLDNKANIHAYYDCALRYAADKGYLEIVLLLLDRGADKYARNERALYNAIIGGHSEIVKLLQNYKRKATSSEL